MVHEEAQTRCLAVSWRGAAGARVVARRPRGHRCRHQTSRRNSSPKITAAATRDASSRPDATGFASESKNLSTQTMRAKPTIASHGPWRINHGGGGRSELPTFLASLAAVERGQMVHHTGPARKNSAKTTGSHTDQMAMLATRPATVEEKARQSTITTAKPASEAARTSGTPVRRNRYLTSGVPVMSMPGGAASSPTPPKMCSARISGPSAIRTARSSTSRSSATLRRW